MDCDFIEIGTSNFDTLIQSCSKETIGISVEPLSNYLEDLPNKPHVIKFNAAISNQAGELDMYYVPPEDVDKYLPQSQGLKGCNSLGQPHPTVVTMLKKRNLEHLIQTRKVPVVTFQNLIEKFNVRSINYLKIDTEGHDCIILENMLEYYQKLDENSPLWPQKIKFESNVLTPRENINQIVSKFKQKNYVIQTQTQEDTILIRTNKKSSDAQDFRILCLSDHLSNNQGNSYGQELSTFIEKLKKSRPDKINFIVRTCSSKINFPAASKIFDGNRPNLILTHQDSIGHGKYLSYKLDVPLIIVLHRDIKEYLKFYPNFETESRQASLILCWSNDVKEELSRNVRIRSLYLDPEENWINPTSVFWDLIYRKISIIVPCHGVHIHHLDVLLENFTQFSVKPYEVIISVSVDENQSLSETAEKISDLSKTYRKHLNLKFYVSNKPLTASQNRNLGAYQSTGDILLFLDADDQYHSQLIEIIEYIWRKYSPINVHWKFLLKDDLQNFLNQRFSPEQISIIKTSTAPKTAYGHVAIDKIGWNHTPWPNVFRGEDCPYNLKLYQAFPGRSLILNCNLSLYRIENSLNPHL